MFNNNQSKPQGKEKLWQFGLPIFLFIIVIAFWSYLNIDIITVTPTYTGEMEALKTLNWSSIWKNVYLSNETYWYYRFSPTALFPLAILDRDVLAPALGIEFPARAFKFASRLIPVGVLGAGLMAIAVYFLARWLEFTTVESFIAGIYIGVFKGIGYFFKFASTVEVIPLFVIYICMTILFFLKYLTKGGWKLLIGYYLFFLLTVGAWEQWVNLLAFLILFSIGYMLMHKKVSKQILIHGSLIPLLVFSVYFYVKLPYAKLETTNKGQEAEYVFNYFSEKLMAEEVAANASFHIADVIEPVLLPWPMLSRTVVDNIDPALENLWNYNRFRGWSRAHYLAFADWYAGLLFGVFSIFSIWLALYIYKHPKEFMSAGVSLLLIWTGFLAHLPVMWRAYFIVPGWVGMLGYKHMQSVIGAALLMAWLFQKFSIWIRQKNWRLGKKQLKLNEIFLYGAYFGLLALLLVNNYSKVVTAFYLKSRGLPW